MDGTQSGVCRMCGCEGVGLPFAKWVKPTFTDWDKLRPGTICCHACQFCTAESAPGLAERVGKDKQQKMRNYSHFALNGVWTPLSKGDKRRMRELLFAGAEVVVIADSGQKHLLPWARLGWWTFETTISRPFPEHLTHILNTIEPLYNGGISKIEIETGQYDPRRILAIGLDAWRVAEKQIKTWRGTVPLALALFLAQKEDVIGDTESTGSRNVGNDAPIADMAGDRPVVQIEIPF
jgi:hypothetical protein